MALTTRFDVRKYVGTTVANKVVAALNIESGESVRLELSEEELEMLMDEITLPIDGDTEEMLSLRKKMIDMMARFRSAI